MIEHPIGTVPFHPSQRERFGSGELAPEWARRYPKLFDEDDLRLATSQPYYHFFEWLGAIVLFNTTGYLSLVEKYEFRAHPRKVQIVEQLVPPEALEAMRGGEAQCPDLLVYAPDLSDWFFCEVKGPRDRLRPVQKQYFASLSTRCAKPVYVLRFREMKEAQIRPPAERPPCA